MALLEIEDVHKSYASGFTMSRKKVLNGLSLKIAQGDIYGFLGSNAAGKTTTIKILLGLVKPDSGTFRLFDMEGWDPRARARVGYLPENPYFYHHLTGEEFIRFCGGLYSLKGAELTRRTNEVLDTVGLDDARRQKLKGYSKGMLQKIGLAQALINDPEFLVLDEPFTGLDPLGRKRFRDIIFELKRRGRTIFFSSHILADTELVSDRVGILMDGKLATDLALPELLDLDKVTYEIRATRILKEDIEKLKVSIRGYERREDEVLVVLGSEKDAKLVIETVYASGGRLLSATPQRPTLEEFFLNKISPETDAVETGVGERSDSISHMPVSRSGAEDRAKTNRVVREPILSPQIRNPGGLGGPVPGEAHDGKPKKPVVPSSPSVEHPMSAERSQSEEVER